MEQSKLRRERKRTRNVASQSSAALMLRLRCGSVYSMRSPIDAS